MKEADSPLAAEWSAGLRGKELSVIHLTSRAKSTVCVCVPTCAHACVCTSLKIGILITAVPIKIGTDNNLTPQRGNGDIVFVLCPPDPWGQL